MFRPSEIVLVSSVTIFLLYKLWSKKQKSSRPPLPPGPPPEPIIGNFRQIPQSRAELTYMEWSKQYSKYTLLISLLGAPVIILNSAKSAMALLDKHGAKYSDRPRMEFYAEQGWTHTLSLMSRGPTFRKHRRMFQSEFTKKNCVQYRGAQEEGATKLAVRILENQEKWKDWIVLFATTIILDITYGIKAEGPNTQMYIETAHKGSNAISNGGQPGASAVDVFPWIRKLPHWFKLIPSLEFARKCYPDVTAMHELPFVGVKRELASGITKPSFVHRMLQQIQDPKLEKHENPEEDVTEADIKGAAGALFVAALDTTSATIIMFVLSMTLNPHVQEKAWRELDTLVGRDRLPTLNDRERMPYLEHMLQEVYSCEDSRLISAGIPHKSSEDDVYDGMFIPKAPDLLIYHPSSLVIPNAYAMCHDTSLYYKPEDFEPDRYISAEEGGRGEPFPIGHFGFGRRVCPGRYLADNGVWIAIATILHTLKIGKKRDSEGKEITPVPEISTGITTQAGDFPCVFTPRFEGVEKLLAA
ncbi:cytochrome p450 protein [Rutstroemia sp. NJR-2017a WRK4]|nr:cytochrome p450 protein [Rutstroemia sp. NJR-2017a WRK4]